MNQYAKYDETTLYGLMQMADSCGFPEDVQMWQRELAKPQKPGA